MRSTPRTLVVLLVTTAGPLSGLAAQSRMKSEAPVALARLAVAAPANVTVTGDLRTATLTWGAAAGAASYRVLRSTDPAVAGTETVRTGATSGAIALAVPQSVTQPLLLVCQPNPTPVTITIQ